MTMMLEKKSTQLAARAIQIDHESALREARDALRWLKEQIAEAERGLDQPFTPGNMGSMVAKIEAARWKAKALREALAALGAVGIAP